MWVRVGESGKMKHAYTTWANKPFIFFSCFLFGACIIKSVHHTVFPRACVRACVGVFACMHALVSGSSTVWPPDMMSEFQARQKLVRLTPENTTAEKVRVCACACVC